MKKTIQFFTVIAVSFMLIGTAGADSIKGRLGISGKAGINTAGDGNLNDSSSTKLNVDSGFTTGGGLIFGITDILAVEADVTYFPSSDYKLSGQKIFEVETIVPSIGLQLRNNVADDLSAYLGGGVDILFANATDNAGNKADIKTRIGGHVNGGGDYFITKNFALNLDLRGIFFGNANIKAGGAVFAKYDPMTFVATIGVRWFPW